MSKVNKNKPRLGRGLSSLLSLSESDRDDLQEVAGDAVAPELLRPVDMAAVDGVNGAGVLELPVDEILPNPHQPRRNFDDAALAELASSLKSTGLIQPIIVRRGVTGYELIAGERRLRAAKLAGLKTLPAIVKEVDGYTQAQMALIENIQREDLNPIDRALAYRALIEQLGLTHAELATRLGEDRTGISHFLRLLDLSESVREMIQSGELSLGHGKVLGRVTDLEEQLRLARTVVAEELSVRQLESLVSTPKMGPVEATPVPLSSSAHIKDLEKTLSHHLQMRVQVKWSGKSGKGKVIIHYTLDEFDQLKERLGIVTD